MKKILIIDDDEFFCEALAEIVKREGHESDCAYTLMQGLKKAGTGGYDVVFLDVQLPDGNGLKILSDLQKSPSRPEVIIITGMGNHSGAKLAIESGAWDYIQKGDAFERIRLSLRRVLEYRKNKQIAGPVALKRNRIIGESQSLLTCLDLVAQAASSDVNVLITGQTGTGKELFARTIHQNSSRAEKDFIAVDCAALTETLVESTLFGHEKGSFTGAEKQQDGLVKLADGGTLFLDEIGELPMSVQKSFLRVLQEKRFRSVGGKREIKSDFRLISATNRDLESMVKSNGFREDLLYRIRAVSIHLPTLAERSDDIRPLTHYYLDKLYEKSGMEVKSISSDFFEYLEAYHWPGNVRELTHALESAFAAALGGTLMPQHLPAHIRIQAAYRELDMKSEKKPAAEAKPKPFPSFKEHREAATREYLTELFIRTKGDIRQACRISGFSRSRLYELLRTYHISV